MARLTLNGTWTALVTPFATGGESVDWQAYERLVQDQIQAGITGLVPCGTTGETPTLSDDEQLELVRCTVRVAAGRVPVLVGTGSNNTRKTIDASLAAMKAGATAVMVVMPYYNKPSQTGMRWHIEAVAQAVSAPIVLYNIPGRTGVMLSAQSTLELLDSCPDVVGVKDATGRLDYCQEVVRGAGERVQILSGDDPLTLPLMSVGAKGVVSVTSNLYPKAVQEAVALAQAGDFAAARARHLALYPVHRVLLSEPNPEPIKAALAMKGRMQPDCRLPLVGVTDACHEALRRVMEEFEAS